MKNGANSSDRATLLSLLIDKEVLDILKGRLSPEMRADLVMELVNPYRPLKTREKAKLGGVSEKAITERAARERDGLRPI